VLPDRAAELSGRSGSTDRRAVVALFVLAVAIRALTAFRIEVIFADGPSFIELASQIGTGNWEAVLGHPYHPLYPALLLLVRALGTDLETAGTVCSIAGGSLAVLGLHAFLRDAFGARVAWIGAALLAIGAYPVRFASDVQSDGVYLGFFLWSVAWLWRALERQSSRAALWAGMLAGLAYLTRPEGVGLVVVGGFLAAARLGGRRWTLGQGARWLASLVAGFAVFSMPYLFALSRVNGSWMLSGKKTLKGLLGVLDDPFAVDSSSGALIGGLALLGIFAIVLRRPSVTAAFGWSGRLAWGAAFLGVLALDAAILWLPDAREYASVVVSTLGPGIAVWAAVGLLVKRADRSPDRALFIAAFLALYGLVLAALLMNYGYLSRRHALPPLALLFGYAAIGTNVLADVLRSGVRRLWGGSRLSVGVSVGLALVIVASSELPKTLRRHRDDAIAERFAAEWLRDEIAKGGTVAATKARTAYYAGASWEWFPLRYETGDPGGSEVDRLRYGDAEILIIDHEVDSGRGHRTGRPEFVELHRVELDDQRALVYRIDRARRR